ncbi:MerR HTH family regulatory protein [Hydrobacter penzbergensis]|uniref:MerR HTH family regulatory protein n=1 Tax=Hydrobacter penzbergensis TaxID=1235997 RepID=A0A8X8IBD4_9BACT|nr:MerR family transcriptional regulator [Hydrobacter penzbergensis]SDW70599.1 MerR HTH family regulatory protein [Hydrobacter penzbergensis]
MRKNLLQLDMFSAMPESPVMEENVMEEPVMIVPIPEEPKAIPSEPVIFADERIVVKLKQQATVPASPSPAVAVNRTKTAGKRGRKSFKEIDSEVDLINVPDEEALKQKLYYSISEVAGWFNVNTSLLRYWENEFDILQPRKTRKGDRLFRAEDIRNLQLIYYLLRQRKFSIAGARNYLKTNKKKVDTQTQLVQSLTKFKSFLLELKATL